MAVREVAMTKMSEGNFFVNALLYSDGVGMDPLAEAEKENI